MNRLLVLAALFASSLAAQYLPTYYIGTGVSFDYWGKTGFAASTDFAAQIGGTASKVYSFTSLDMTQAQASLRTGVAYMFYSQGNWALVALGNAGVATGSGPTLGAFTAGGFMAYDVGAKLSKGTEHFYVAVGGRLLNITSQVVQPIFTITFGKSF